MKTLDETIAMIERHMKLYCAADYDKPCLHYLNAYRQLSQGLVGENTEIRPEGIYCKVCGTRLDKDWDDEDVG